VLEMKRLGEMSGPMAWLDAHPTEEEALTGFDATGWPASTWGPPRHVRNSGLAGLGTHDDVHRRRLESVDVAPLIIGDVSVEATTTVTGTPLGFVVRPGLPWARLTWAEYLDRPSLTRALHADPRLECLDWQRLDAT
jgi:hypothetical protein